MTAMHPASASQARAHRLYVSVKRCLRRGALNSFEDRSLPRAAPAMAPLSPHLAATAYGQRPPHAIEATGTDTDAYSDFNFKYCVCNPTWAYSPSDQVTFLPSASDPNLRNDGFSP